MVSLIFRNLFFTILQPGIVAGLVPYLIVRYGGSWADEVPFVVSVLGLALIVVGTTILLACIVQFILIGKGTLSPIDPTTKLVAVGLYRYTRNPMYVGVTAILLGEAIVWASPYIFVYAILVVVAFNTFVAYHEEPRLRREFGDEYSEYCSRVRRWI